MRPGTVVAERFRIGGQAGEGGMGIVYRAEDLQPPPQPRLPETAIGARLTAVSETPVSFLLA